MIRAEDTALVLLAAGRSARFGEADKLAAKFLGHPLALHVVTALESVPFAHRIAVVAGTGIDFAVRGYRLVDNPTPERGIGCSLACGATVAREVDVRAVIVALADMPRVTAAQIWRLLDYAAGEDAVLASSDGRQPRPPALFGRARLAELAALDGDHGARELIAGAHHIVTSPAELVDVDTPDQLAALEASIRGAARRSG